MVTRNITQLLSVAGAPGLLAVMPVRALAHCDGLDGPVVKAAQRALETRNPAFALIWVQEKDEREIRLARIAITRAGKIRHPAAGFSAAADYAMYGDPLTYGACQRYKDCVSVRTFLPRTLEGDEADLTRVANPPPLSALD